MNNRYKLEFNIKKKSRYGYRFLFFIIIVMYITPRFAQIRFTEANCLALLSNKIHPILASNPTNKVVLLNNLKQYV